LDKTTGLATTWNPIVDGDVYCLELSGDVLFAGGYFNSIDGTPQAYLAALDTTQANGSLLPWAPKLYDAAYTLLLHGNHLFMGGNPEFVENEPQTHLARLTVTSASTLPADQITGSSGRLNGSVLTLNAGDSFRFRWGLASGTYPNVIAGTPDPIGEIGWVPVSVTLAGLAEGQTVYYRLVLVTASGQVYGGEQSFTTLSAGGNSLFLPLVVR
ncbi:MAG: hypothetical protein GYA20_09555, partial [Chloroflexi bacterium]|nr:hypothetical protein [Chloroflexota bacterium]